MKKDPKKEWLDNNMNQSLDNLNKSVHPLYVTKAVIHNGEKKLAEVDIKELPDLEIDTLKIKVTGEGIAEVS